MKNSLKLITVAALSLLCGLGASAQSSDPVFYDASVFPLQGKIEADTYDYYGRMPARLKDVVRKELWDLGRDAAGLYIRFRTNSTKITAKWNHLYGTSMNHQPTTGSRGLDLYIHNDGEWVFAGSGRPTGTSSSKATVISGMDGSMKECLLYLSLYDGVDSLYIGIDAGAQILQPELNSPKTDKPVIAYGTSILQGGCASRAGMAYTNIFTRKLDRTVINFGFSGNAHLDPEVAEFMASHSDPGAYLLDFGPNCTAERVAERGEKFIRILRDAHPMTPIIFVETQEYPYIVFDAKTRDSQPKVNAEIKKLYDACKKRGDKNVYYVECKGLIGDDAEGTVDGNHLTDLGMMRYADKVLPTLRKALKKSTK